jgi:hypothetical protein
MITLQFPLQPGVLFLKRLDHLLLFTHSMFPVGHSQVWLESDTLVARHTPTKRGRSSLIHQKMRIIIMTEYTIPGSFRAYRPIEPCFQLHIGEMHGILA